MSMRIIPFLLIVMSLPIMCGGVFSRQQDDPSRWLHNTVDRNYRVSQIIDGEINPSNTEVNALIEHCKDTPYKRRALQNIRDIKSTKWKCAKWGCVAGLGTIATGVVVTPGVVAYTLWRALEKIKS